MIAKLWVVVLWTFIEIGLVSMALNLFNIDALLWVILAAVIFNRRYEQSR